MLAMKPADISIADAVQDSEMIFISLNGSTLKAILAPLNLYVFHSMHYLKPLKVFYKT